MSTFTPAHFRGDPLLSSAGRHLVGRFSYGVTPALARQVQQQGGPRAWFDRQLTPDRVADPGVDDLRAWWSGLSRTPAQLWQRQVAGIEGGWEVMFDYERWVLMRRMTSRRQLLEVMTELWENHLNVPAVGDSQFVHRTAYGDAIRAGALGRFDDLLHTAVTHPAMLIYLDNAVSTAKHPNENLGRELLELHTVGRGQYDEDDVKDSARILTGWTVDMWNTWAPSYDASRHARGTVTVMGFSDPNADADGRDLTRRYLSYLAHHPATASAAGPQAGGQVRRRRPLRGPGGPAGAGLPRPRHGDRAGAAGAGRVPGVRGCRRVPRSATRVRTSSPPTGRSASP